jgi:hypothetical protein
MISSTLNIEEVYERFAEGVHKLIPFDRIVISLNNHKNRTITLSYVAGMDLADYRPGAVIPLKGSVHEKIVHTRASVLLQMEDEDKIVGQFYTLLPAFRAGIRSMMSIPLISRDEVIGVLHFLSIKPEGYTGQDLKLAENIGFQVAGAITNAMLLKDVKEKEAAWLFIEHMTSAEMQLINTKIAGEIPARKSIRFDPWFKMEEASYVNTYLRIAKRHGRVEIRSDLKEGLRDVDVIYTDTFVSMGEEGEAERRKKLFAPYQVNSTVVGYAKKDVSVMHCLPAHRGEEITSDVLDGRQSIAWEQASNKLLVEKAILLYLYQKKNRRNQH